ncbi:hypothetical protein ACS0TY_020172 [Phlomoides rotata]
MGSNGTSTPSKRIRNSFSYGNDDEEGKKDDENMLLVVATLINAVTFSAGVNPPGGVWQDDVAGHKAGRSIYSTQKVPFHIFLVLNTLAFSTSIVLLTSLTYRFPFFIYLWAAIAAMFFTYAAAIFAIAPDESVKFRYLLAAAAVPFAIHFLQSAYKWL